MKFDVEKVSGIGEYDFNVQDGAKVYKVDGRAFLVVWPNTVEVRCDGNLIKLLTEKYESVMRSRYFGRGGIEVVISGQLSGEEICDLVRLSYNLTKKAV